VRCGWSPSCRLSSDSPPVSGRCRPAVGPDPDVAFVGGRPRSSTHEGRQVGVVSDQSAGYGKTATQPCPCGYFGDPVRECSCSPMMIQGYRKRISGPLLDRSAQPPCGIDIHVEVPRVDYDPVGVPLVASDQDAARGRTANCRAIAWARRAPTSASASRRRVTCSVIGLRGLWAVARRACRAQVGKCHCCATRKCLHLHRRHRCGAGGSARVLPAGRRRQEPAACVLPCLGQGCAWR